MPRPRRSLDVDRVSSLVAEEVFGPSGDAHGLGVELEWLTSQGQRDRRLPIGEATGLIDRLSPLPAGSRLTLEPGGQLELSSAPYRTIDEVCNAAAADLAELDLACDACQVELIALGADPVRPPERVALAPRYQAMERYFDHLGRAGRTMMCNTAAIQVNVGLGEPDQVVQRWRLANQLGPTLIACFANSPFAGGLPSGWQSSRLRAWWSLDPSRSAPVACESDPVTAWTAYALDARVMLVDAAEGGFVPMIEPLRFGDWLADGHELGWPTLGDLRYHLTTLFPPVRPKGWLELRMFDALPSPAWQVAVAVTGALLGNPGLADDLSAAVADSAALWVDAAQLGLGHPVLGRTGIAVFDLALEALADAGVDPDRRQLVEAYADHWVRRGRSPADDRIDSWRRTGELFPPAESPEAASVGIGTP
jgi:glutamate--cysteine ligase